MRSAWLFVLSILMLIACLDDPDEDVATSQSAIEPRGLWIVSTGKLACDDYLRTTCPRSAVACLVNEECHAFFDCSRACSPDENEACVADCREDHPASWKLIDPFFACATKEPACR